MAVPIQCGVTYRTRAAMYDKFDEGDWMWPMIYDNENRGRAWEPAPQMQASQHSPQPDSQQDPQHSPQPDSPQDPRQAAAMERRQRKQFSHVGLAAAAFMLLTLAAQVVVMVLVELLNSLLGDFIDFYGFSGRMLMSSLPMYLVAFPAVAGLLQLVPKCGAPQKEQWGFWKFASFFVIAVGIGLAGNILGRLVGLLQPSGPDSAELDQLIRNSSLWVNLLTTVIMAPVVEELFFRKLVMDRLLGYGQKAAIIMSGIMFGMAHGNFSQFFYAFGIGILWAYVYAKTGKVGYTIGFHMLFNLLGGVIAVELSKGAQGLAEGPWIIRQIESILGIDMGWLVTAFSSVMILAYFFFMLACLIAAIILIIMYRRQITFRPGQWPLRKGRALKTAFLNAGMIVYFVICCGLFILNW